MRKRYISLTGVAYTFPVFPEEGKSVFVSLKGSELDYKTDNENIQKAIERHKRFTSRQIGLARGYKPFTEELRHNETVDNSPFPNEDKSSLESGINMVAVVDLQNQSVENTEMNQEESNSVSDEDFKAAVFEEVTTFQAAREILRAEPYNIPFQGITKPESIMKQAEKVHVSFPNLKMTV